MKLSLISAIALLVLAACKNHQQPSRPKKVSNFIDTISQQEYVQYDTSNADRIIFDSAYKRRIGDSGNRFDEEAMIAYKGYKVIVKSSFIKDSVSPDEPNLFNPICTNQRILFYSDQKLVRTVTYPVKTISQKNWNGDKIRMLENVINYIGFIKTKAGFVVVVSGWGGCNTCSVFDGLFYPKGDIVPFSMGRKMKMKSPLKISIKRWIALE